MDLICNIPVGVINICLLIYQPHNIKPRVNVFLATKEVGKVHPGTGHESPEGERCIALFSL
jgi:hypothetical protein